MTPGPGPARDPQPPEHPQACCTQQTITVPPDVLAKTAQKHDYPSAAWRRSYARRTGAERGFATAKDPASQRHRPRLVPPHGPDTARCCSPPTLLAVRNQRILAAWNSPAGRKPAPRRQGPAPENPQAPPQDPHRHGRRRAALTSQPRTRATITNANTTTARALPEHAKTRPGTAKRAPPAPSASPARAGPPTRPECQAQT